MTANSPDPFQLLRQRMREAALKAAQAKGGRKPPLRFRASEAGNCPRQIAYRLLGYEPRPDSPELMMYQVAGNVWQDVIRALFLQYGVPIEGIDFRPDGEQKETMDTQRVFEATSTDGQAVSVTVSARADGKFPETPLGPAQFEFKTKSHYKHEWLEKALQGGYKMPDGTKVPAGNDAAVARVRVKEMNNYQQVQITMAMFDDTVTCYGAMSRNTVQPGLKPTKGGDPAGIYIELDEAEVAQILSDFADIKLAVQRNELPKPAHFDGSSECNYCAFYDYCPTRSGRMPSRTRED